jgi:hypothetical protein
MSVGRSLNRRVIGGFGPPIMQRNDTRASEFSGCGLSGPRDCSHRRERAGVEAMPVPFFSPMGLAHSNKSLR